MIGDETNKEVENQDKMFLISLSISQACLMKDMSETL